jgi:hypothetical protein
MLDGEARFCLTDERVDGGIQYPASGIQHRLGAIPRQAERAFLLAIALLGASATPGWAQESTAPEEERPPRHRISIGAQWFDAAEGDSVTGSLAYSWVPLEHHGFAATVPVVGSDVSGAEGSGIGDTRLQYSWVPSAEITAAAWVPSTLGMGFGLILPTGDPAKGTGVDRWVAIPTLGWVFTLGEESALQPSLQYLYSFGEDRVDEHVSSANLVLTFLYVTKKGFWIDYTASLFRDFEPVETTNEDHFLTVGQQFTEVLGGSVTLGSMERPPIQNPAFARSSDEFVELTLHFVLPW